MASLPIQGQMALPQPLIIDRPDWQSGKQRAVFNVLTAAFWVLWVVLWLPLVTLLGWYFFGYQLHFHMIKLEGYVGFLDVLGIYALVILALSGCLLVWAKYNHLRFRGLDRRENTTAPSLDDLARIHGSTGDEVARWQASSIATVHHDADGRILRVDT